MGDETVEAMKERLPGLSDTDLATLRQQESDGEKRTTALEAIDAEIKRRTDAAEKGHADQAALDQKAQAEGFADNAAKVEAEAAAKPARKARAPKTEKAASVPNAEEVATANARGLDEARERINAGVGGEMKVGFGDDKRAFKEIPFADADVRIDSQRLLTGVDIIMRTGKLTGTVTVTHAWLIAGDSPLMRAELGAPMIVQPNQQIKIAAGRLAFA